MRGGWEGQAEAASRCARPPRAGSERDTDKGTTTAHSHRDPYVKKAAQAPEATSSRHTTTNSRDNTTMKRFKRKQKKLKEKQTARLIAESPLTCALDIWQARKEARAKAEYALSHEDFLMAEADLVHHLNRLKASTGLDEKKSELVEERKETQALREFFEG